MNKRNITKYKQNKPTLIVKDLEKFAPAEIIYSTLLKRGVFKWLAVRRQLIRLKDVWKVRVRESIKIQHEAQEFGDHYRRIYEKGYRRAVEDCRKELRALCHSHRWQAPDHDVDAKRWLESRGEK